MNSPHASARPTPAAGSDHSVEVRAVPACAADRVAVEAAAQAKVCRLAPERQVPGDAVSEAPAEEVPGRPQPAVLAGFGPRADGLPHHAPSQDRGAPFSTNTEQPLNP